MATSLVWPTFGGEPFLGLPDLMSRQDSSDADTVENATSPGNANVIDPDDKLGGIPLHARRFVLLSGCSGGGKSTVLAELAHRGSAVSEEPGRQIVREQLATAGSALPWIDPLRFVELSVLRSLDQMAKATHNRGRTFFDRGIVDALSYLEHLELPVPAYLENAVRRICYHPTVFMTPPWPEIFVTDGERRHGFDEARAQYGSLLSTYHRLGYATMELPRCSAAERATFILDCLGSQADLPAVPPH